MTTDYTVTQKQTPSITANRNACSVSLRESPRRKDGVSVPLVTIEHNSRLTTLEDFGVPAGANNLKYSS